MPKMGEGYLPFLYVPDGSGRYVKIPVLTETQRDALSAVNGMLIWSSTTGRVEGYYGGYWRKVDGRGRLSILRVGEYWVSYPIGTDSTEALSADRIYAIPFYIDRLLTIDRLAIRVTSAAAGKIARLGIYRDDGTCYPGALVKDYGTVSVASAALVAASADQQLTEDLYWFVVVSDGTPTIRGSYPRESPLGIDSTNFIASAINKQWEKAGVGSGALASTFPSGATIDVGVMVLVLPRLKSLD